MNHFIWSQTKYKAITITKIAAVIPQEKAKCHDCAFLRDITACGKAPPCFDYLRPDRKNVIWIKEPTK